MVICTICTQIFEMDNGEALITKCGHIYHKGCLLKWLQSSRFFRQHGSCPSCRASVPDGSFEKVFLSFELGDYQYENLERKYKQLDDKYEKLKRKFQKEKEKEKERTVMKTLQTKAPQVNKMVYKRYNANATQVCVKTTRRSVYQYSI